MEILNLKSDSLESNMHMELTNYVEENVSQTATWSIEILPHNISNLTLIPDFVNEVYITMIPGASFQETIQTAHQIQTIGKQAVPHIAGRSFKGVEELSTCLSELQETGINRALLIGGGQSEPAGDITCVMDMLKTGLFAKYGINAFDFAGHPEGNPDDQNSEAHLLEKLLWTEEHGIPARIVTQWCLDSDATNDWISGLRQKGIRNPIHIGIPGPSTMKTLLSFAKVCGVQASAQVLRKQGFNISKLMFVNKPDKIISELRGYDKLHLYPFGGIAKSADWLNEWQRINC